MSKVVGIMEHTGPRRREHFIRSIRATIAEHADYDADLTDADVVTVLGALMVEHMNKLDNAQRKNAQAHHIRLMRGVA